MKLESHHLFSVFREEVRERLLSLAQYEVHEDGVCLFEENDPPDALCLVLSGEVDLTKMAPIGRCISIARVGADDYFGDMGPIDGCGRSTGAYTVGKTAIAKIPAGPLLDILKAEPSEVSLQFFGHISERLRRANTRFVEEVLRKEKLHFVGEMARSIVHDFKSQMAGIQCVTNVLCAENQNENVARCCRLIEQQIGQMSAMAQELLDYSQGRCNLVLKEVSIEDLFTEIESLKEGCIGENSVDISFAAIDARIEVDRCRIVRVLQNLLSNAVEALPAEGGKISIEASRTDEGSVDLRVIDNGSGIPEEIRAEVFEPFVTAGKKQGIGLGMAIAKTIVEAHGGKITFLTERGKGTTFTIRLPVLG